MGPEEDWSDKTEEYPEGFVRDLEQEEGRPTRPVPWDWSKVRIEDDDGDYS